ncbi:hypothetical protein SAMN04488511_111111 [Pedobacter suwonensis]|uniref:Uncharacterized protein n=1 Tax=Pedobacter suwonensis TaxID=332999 RepID=A0A1I0TLV9_9SPHI|nr:hypothetical protein SAMN04488511_111111 [Pedobacter suwonensis]
MFYLAYVFKLTINGFYHRPFTEHNFVGHGHQAIFHIVPDIGNQMYIADEQYFD